MSPLKSQDTMMIDPSMHLYNNNNSTADFGSTPVLMSLQPTPARSSPITTPSRTRAASALGLKRPVSSPSKAYDDDEQLDDTGTIASLADDLTFRHVPQYIEYIRNRMFCDMPERAGMNSTRIAEVLNVRARLPPFVTVAHINALCASSTQMEREMAQLAKVGIVRRVAIPHRGVGAAAVGDGVANVREWHALVREHNGLPAALKEKYVFTMNKNPTSVSITGSAFTPSELSSLIAVGLLTSSTAISPYSSGLVSQGATSLASISSSGSRHAAGSLEAIGGASATQHIHGGTSFNTSRAALTTYNFSLPNTGTHLKLLMGARMHLVGVVKKTKYKEMLLSVLRERWEGGVVVPGERDKRKKARGEFSGVLPGRTRKWKQYYGMRFEWILEECLGAGLLELFETGSVGRAVRISR